MVANVFSVSDSIYYVTDPNLTSNSKHLKLIDSPPAVFSMGGGGGGSLRSCNMSNNIEVLIFSNVKASLSTKFCVCGGVKKKKMFFFFYFFLYYQNGTEKRSGLKCNFC